MIRSTITSLLLIAGVSVTAIVLAMVPNTVQQVIEKQELEKFLEDCYR